MNAQKKAPLTVRRPLCQYRTVPGEPENYFSPTGTSFSPSRPAKSDCNTSKDTRRALVPPSLRGNILLIRLKSIGDIVLTLPAVHAVRTAFPDSRITFLTSKENESLLEGFAGVDTVMTLNRARLRGYGLKAMAAEVITLLRDLRKNRFELVVDLQGYGETALLTWLTGAPCRWGPGERRARRPAYTHKAMRDPSLHPAERHLALLSQCGLEPRRTENRFALPESAAAAARQFFTDHGLDPARRTVFIQPFTGSPEKNWPLQNYIGVARHFESQGLQVLFGGGPAEQQALEPARQAGFATAAGTPLLVSAGLMGLSTLVVGGNTGLLHLAVALGKRALMLAVSTHLPCNAPPWEHADWTLAPQANRDLSSITTVEVQNACAQALAEFFLHPN